MSAPQPIEEIRRVVSSTTQQLQGRYLADRSGSRADTSVLGQLADLRGAPLDEPGNDPDVWELTLGALPLTLAGRGTAAPTKAELSVHTAVVLFAHLQQGRDRPAHQPGVSFGQAVQALARARATSEGPLNESVVKRLHALALAPTHTMRARHLYTLVKLMHAERSIGLDFGALASDLFLLQFPQHVSRVRLEWGRALHARRPTTESPSTDPTATISQN